MGQSQQRSAACLNFMCRIVEKDYGLPVSAVLQGSGVLASLLDQPEAKVQVEQELRVIENILRLCPDTPGLGLQIGRQFHVSVYGPAAFAASNCDNLGDVIATSQAHPHLLYWLLDIRFQLGLAEPSIVLCLDHIPAHLQRFVLERDLAGMLATGRGLFPEQLPLRRLELHLPEPSSEEKALFREALGLEPRFSCRQTRFVLHPKDLMAALPSASRVVRDFWVGKLRQLRQSPASRKQTRQRVMHILQSTTPWPDMEEVAARLHITSRQLRRRLEAEGSSFRALLDERRALQAEIWLRDSPSSVADIASRLGFQEVASFSRAFKRWRGLSPLAWRKSQALAGGD